METRLLPTETHTSQPTEVPVVAHISTLEPDGCREDSGGIKSHQIGADELPKALDVSIYLPPCYEEQPAHPFPLLVLLHGQGYTEGQWISLGIQDAADSLISAGEVPPFLVVFPREEYSLQSPADSFFDEAVLDVLLPWIEMEYAVCAEKDCRAIGGISRGGAWALRLGLMNWQTFGAIGAHSPVPFPPDVHSVIYWLREIPEGEVPIISIDIGDIDTYHRYAHEFHQALLDQDVGHTWTVYAGGHEVAYWEAHLEAYLRWYTFAWSLANDG
jgi:enterochelin esterase-like enzyme